METVRSFISIKIPLTPSVRKVQGKLREIKGVNVSDDVHLTLRFLDEVELRKIKELSECMRSLEKYHSFKVSVKGLGAFPNVKDPRIIWIGADMGEPFYDILSELDIMLDASSIYYDKKPFKAHVTMGRVKSPSVELGDLLSEEKNLDAGSFVCSEISLMGSKLTSRGAVHSAISSFKLIKD